MRFAPGWSRPATLRSRAYRVFCGRCAEDPWAGAVAMGRDFELAARCRDDLRIEVVADDLADPAAGPAPDAEAEAARASSEIHRVLGRSPPPSPRRGLLQRLRLGARRPPKPGVRHSPDRFRGAPVLRRGSGLPPPAVCPAGALSEHHDADRRRHVALDLARCARRPTATRMPKMMASGRGGQPGM